MEGVETKKLKFPVNRKGFRRIALAVAVLLVAGAATTYFATRSKNTSKAAVTEQTAKVARGDLTTTVSATGQISSSSSTDINSKVSGTLTKVYFKDGDTVKAGDLLYELDDKTVKNNIEKLRINLQKSQIKQQTNTKSLSNLIIKAPFDGFASNIELEEGDAVSKNAAVLTLVDQSKLKVTVPFNGSAINGIALGSEATVNIQSLMQSIQGKVTYIGNASYTASTGGELYNVEITLDNPGSLKEGMKANAELKTAQGMVSSTDAGSLSYLNNEEIKSESGGTIKSLNVKDGQWVKNGEILAEIVNDDLTVSAISDNAELVDIKSQLEEAEKQLGYCKIYAPIDGTISNQEINEGNTIKADAVLCNISNTSQMECKVSVDELDISKIKIGQKVNLTIDALQSSLGKPVPGEVTKIAVNGTGSNGVTAYPVEIKILDTSGLRSGMNASAEIVVESKQNVLYLPIEAIRKVQSKAFVLVKAGDGSAAAGDTSKTGSDGQMLPQQGNKQETNQGGEQSGTGNVQRQDRTGNSGANANTTQGGSGRNANRTQSGSGGSVNRTQAANGQTPQGANSSRMSQFGAGGIMKPVEIGINNETYIEIVSGLSEGDEVLLPAKTASNSSSAAAGGTNILRGNSMGGMMGGAPQGGMR